MAILKKSTRKLSAPKNYRPLGIDFNSDAKAPNQPNFLRMNITPPDFSSYLLSEKNIITDNEITSLKIKLESPTTKAGLRQEITSALWIYICHRHDKKEFKNRGKSKTDLKRGEIKTLHLKTAALMKTIKKLGIKTQEIGFEGIDVYTNINGELNCSTKWHMNYSGALTWYALTEHGLRFSFAEVYNMLENFEFAINNYNKFPAGSKAEYGLFDSIYLLKLCYESQSQKKAGIPGDPGAGHGGLFYDFVNSVFNLLKEEHRPTNLYAAVRSVLELTQQKTNSG